MDDQRVEKYSHRRLFTRKYCFSLSVLEELKIVLVVLFEEMVLLIGHQNYAISHRWTNYFGVA